LNAIHQYVAENKGQLPPALTALTANTVTPVSSTGLNICADLMPNYIPALPTEPSLATAAVTDCTTYNTGYSVTKDAQNRITVSSPVTDNGEVITVTR
jgi:type IV pilus assembly protein PilA